jgi:hypothetical protein
VPAPTDVSAVVAGKTYTFRLTVTDSHGDVATDDVIIKSPK